MPGPLAIPMASWIAEAIAAALARAAASAAAGAVLGGVATLPGDTPREDGEAKPTVPALPRTGEPCQKCPPDLGMKVRRRHGVNWNAYEYQARKRDLPTTLSIANGAMSGIGKALWWEYRLISISTALYRQSACCRRQKEIMTISLTATGNKWVGLGASRICDYRPAVRARPFVATLPPD